MAKHLGTKLHGLVQTLDEMERDVESRSAGFTVWSSTEGLLAGVRRSVSGQVRGQSRQFLRGRGRSRSRRGRGLEGSMVSFSGSSDKRGESDFQEGRLEGSTVSSRRPFRWTGRGLVFRGVLGIDPRWAT